MVSKNDQIVKIIEKLNTENSESELSFIKDEAISQYMDKIHNERTKTSGGIF